jgi:hypothetical protein
LSPEQLAEIKEQARTAAKAGAAAAENARRAVEQRARAKARAADDEDDDDDGDETPSPKRARKMTLRRGAAPEADFTPAPPPAEGMPALPPMAPRAPRAPRMPRGAMAPLPPVAEPAIPGMPGSPDVPNLPSPPRGGGMRMRMPGMDGDAQQAALKQRIDALEAEIAELRAALEESRSRQAPAATPPHLRKQRSMK